MSRVVVEHQLGQADLDAASELLDALATADGHRLLGDDHPVLPPGQQRPPTLLLAREPGQRQAVGLAQVHRAGGGWSLEVAVHPRSGSDEVWRRLLEAGVEVARRAGGGRARLWVHDATDEHDRAARPLGLVSSRDLRQMRRGLPVPESSSLPTRPFVVGRDEEAWLEVNNRAFASHPDQGGQTLEDFRRLEDEPWFDPEGFLLHERDGRLAGFCWTKVHADARPPLGELYVVAVDPYFQGAGLGRLLALAGLEWLAGRGLTVAMLYVDASNHTAVRLYERLGFTVHHVDRAYDGVLPPINEPRT